MTAPLPEDQQRQIAALVAAQGAAQQQIRAQAIAHAQAAAAGFTGWYNTDAVTGWAVKLSGQIETYQRTLAKLTDAYLAHVIGVLLGVRRIRPIGAVDTTQLRQGVTHAGAYGRAADVYRYQQSLFDRIGVQLASGATPDAPGLVSPQQAAIARAVDVADMDGQLAVRAQEQASLEAAAGRGVTGWRRVIHPDLSRGGVCGLCVAASDRLYGTTEPRPVHAKCHCTLLPVTEAHDPGSQLNELDLRRLYKEAGGAKGAKLKRARYQVAEHGELGLVLAPPGKFRTAAAAARDTQTGAPTADLHAVLQRRRDQLTAALPTTRQLAAQDPGSWGEYLTALEARVRDLNRELAA